MAVALDYQTIYYRKKTVHVPFAVHIAAAVMLFCALATKVWIQLQCTAEGYTLAKIRQQTVSLDMERRELELHKSVLLKPDNLIMRSKKKLGLERLNTAQAKKIIY